MSLRRFLASDLPRFEALLAKEGCPICHSISGSDARFFFWFFAELYYSSHMFDELTRSLGFCPAHAARIVSMRTGGHQLVGCHEVILARIRKEITGDRFAPTGACPPCKDRSEMSKREIWFFTSLLNREADFVARYGRPGTLCLPHLRDAADHIQAPMLDRLLAIQDAALSSAASSLERLRSDLGRPDSGSSAKTLRPFLRLALGHDRGEWAFPSIHEADGDFDPPDPVADLLETIRRPDVCCACRAVGRAWIQWGRWLQAQAEKGSHVADLLPTCPAHAWALLDQAGPELAMLITEDAVGRALDGVKRAAGRLTASSKPTRPWSPRAVVQKMRDPALRLRLAREVLALEPVCPVCKRLEIAADRTLMLLFALLGVRPHRDVYQSGYALCVAHFVRALALGPPPVIQSVLVETESAKLAQLDWELEEFLRKSGWESRPEPKQAEQETPWKAVLRFSGSLGRETGQNRGWSFPWDQDRNSALLRERAGQQRPAP